jgi:micrococcal nuclease
MSIKNSFKLIKTGWIALLLLWVQTATGQHKKGNASTLPPGTVTHIVDGDTFDMVDSNHRIVRIRPIGIDAEELKNNAHGSKGPFAKAAKAYLAKLIAHKKVRLKTDLRKFDKYGRFLAYVYVDTIFVNAALLKAGLVRVETEPPNVQHANYFYRLQVEARKAKRGLWAIHKQ